MEIALADDDRRKRILVVEDDRGMAELVRIFAENMAMSVEF